MLNYLLKFLVLLSLRLDYSPDFMLDLWFFRTAVVKSIISVVLCRNRVGETGCQSEAVEKICGGGGGVGASLKKKKLQINPWNRFRLRVADSWLLLFAIWQLSSNVWSDTASIRLIDFQQEMSSMLTMCATYKSPRPAVAAAASFLNPFPQKMGGMLTWGKLCINIHSSGACIVK